MGLNLFNLNTSSPINLFLGGLFCFNAGLTEALQQTLGLRSLLPILGLTFFLEIAHPLEALADGCAAAHLALQAGTNPLLSLL
jgi:hypothetical protein